jgi:arabinoxylan arabinofuranohydrolase
MNIFKNARKVLTMLTVGSLFLLLVFNACTKKAEPFTAYLFAYFVGNGPSEEAIHFAVSLDGYNYLALNNNKAIIASDTISSRGGVRDPHILRGPDGMFYMVVTDLYVPNDGWSNTGMVFLKSDNLMDWTYSKLNIPDLFEEFSDVLRVWAPQTYYDEEAGKYMVYFSMLQPGGSDIIYYAYANDDFSSLATLPQQLFYHPEGRSCIDGDIVFKDGKYHLFFKTEGHGNGLKKAVSERLTEGYVMKDEYLQQTRDAVEGSCIFKLNNSATYILMYDVYMRGTYQFTESTDLETFTVIDESISMNFHPRHGTVVPITQSELDLLLARWGSIDDLGLTSVESEWVKKNNVVFNHQEGTIFLPVKSGTNLAALNPAFKSGFGAQISPRNSVNFENGPVEFTVKMKGLGEKKYMVNARIDHNPVLDGYYADPEIIFSQKHGKFYLYPTSDGYHGWSGNYFKTFSSTDLVNWTDEGVVMDLPKDVPWGTRNAWAPAMAERKIDGKFKYFYYFTAAQKIGVAVADEPTDPFVDSGAPLIDWKPEGINHGQEIDPDVFFDPLSEKSFLYWGNGYLAGAVLNPDMTSIDMSTLKVLTPADGTFREGVEVFFRNGLYYFLWSENDTRHPDYRVRYATSVSPMGPLDIPENNLILAKDVSKGIYGTGHNCVVNVPGADKWYIIYHRFTLPNGINMGGNAGFHREVCIDIMEFNIDGSIKVVVPTLGGIVPVKI